MPTFNFGAGLTNYTGEVLEDFLTYAAQENQTYKEGLIHVKAGVQKKYTLPGMQLGTIIQDRVPTPNSSVGTYTLNERYLEPADFMVYLEFNPRDFEQYYKFAQPHGNLVFRELDPKVQATMLRLLMEGKEEYINHAIWCGAKAATAAHIHTTSTATGATSEIGSNDAYGPMKYFDGAIAKILMNVNAAAGSEDAKSGKVVMAGNSIFATGQAVSTELEAMWKLIPLTIRMKPGLTILMDFKSWDMYDEYMRQHQFKYTDNRQENQHLYLGKRIIPLVGLPESTIIIGNFTKGRDSNLWMGVDLADDENVIKIDRLQSNSELFFFKALLKMDVNIVKPSEIVAHLPFTWTA